MGRIKTNGINQISRDNLIYLSGFIDGEGTITILRFKRKNRKYRTDYRPVILISNTDKSILDWIASVVGAGKVQTEKHTSPNSWNRKPFWKYYLGNNNAILLAGYLLPYLRIKRPQAELLIEFGRTLVDSYYPRSLSTDVLIQRENLTITINNLNRRGKEGE